MRANIQFFTKFPRLSALLSVAVIGLLLNTTAYGQTLIYDAYIRGDNVGEMKVIREVNDEATKITVDTHIEAHMIVKITVDFKSSSTYMNNKLLIGEAESRTNGHLKSSVHTTFKDQHYELNKDGKISKLNRNDLVGADYYYFEVPDNGTESYALATGGMLEMVRKDQNSFYFEHDKKKELHTFKNGVLQELEISHRLYTITFKLRD
ncbi:hypothetical protein BFP97_06260 [Roseivirga sp. 4D4]|uniref:DUF6134 family protein n=1 Tax=Roseivirga sp. 4D4 TaxID=1889784 RepID=UPI0008537D72|nr:DUF6134 family protein [Roseivirga sp. 4D4]OEK01135.1 hypothetical protein BFP97_06260 [Roseivirga sp. 4D4]